MARGLEIRATEDFGPHKKQYPFARENPAPLRPLAVADDDVIYPRWWLERLVSAHSARPDDLAAFRAHSITLTSSGVAPYAQWEARRGTASALGVMATGVSGVIYPPRLVTALHQAGPGFLDVAPTADDVWVCAVAIASGIKTWQVCDEQQDFFNVPGTQVATLNGTNVAGGGNDRQIAATFGNRILSRLREEVGTSEGPAR
ncbi:hypothetical protein [Nocardioides marmoraquaticus]